ncbi:hypothetical protein Tco_0542810 [Tanacetum coccineum]
MSQYAVPKDPNLPYRSSPIVRMIKVIKGKFKKLMDVKIEDVLLTCDTSLEVFNNEFTRLCSMDDDLFTYEVEVTNIPCDSNIDDDLEDDADEDMGYDPSNIRGDYEVELTDEESSDSEDKVAEVFRIDTSVFNYETPTFNEFNYLLKVDPDLLTNDIMRFKTYDDFKNDWIYEWNTNVPWVYDKPWVDEGIWKEPKPVKHTCKPFNYKTRCSKWPTCSWREDGYCNGGNLPGAYIIGDQLHYQDLEWYEALEDSELKEEALRNKAIIKDEEYVAIKEDEYDNLTRTSKEACRAYQEIFCMMDEGWVSIVQVEDIATCLVEYVKFWDDWEVDRYGNANLDYYSEDQYAISIKEDTAYPCLHSPMTTEDEDQYAVTMNDLNITMEEYIRLKEEKARRRAIVFNDTLTSKATLSYEPTVSSLNDEIDFRISYDESDDEDCTDSENDNDKVNMPSFSSPEPTVSYFYDLDFFNDFENEFPVIVYNDALTSKLDFLIEPTVSP